MLELHNYLAASAARHSHLCPRQVLGVRAAFAAAEVLGLSLPRRDKRLLVILETDGCFADGIEVASGASVGHRTLRIEDQGKIAATFIDTETNQAIRIAPQLNVRDKAWHYAPKEQRHYFAQLQAYQVMPVAELFKITPIRLCTPVDEIVSKAGVRTDCHLCGEEIFNEREIIQNGLTLCKTCAGKSYYQVLDAPLVKIDHP